MLIVQFTDVVFEDKVDLTSQMFNIGLRVQNLTYVSRYDKTWECQMADIQFCCELEDTALEIALIIGCQDDDTAQSIMGRSKSIELDERNAFELFRQTSPVIKHTADKLSAKKRRFQELNFPSGAKIQFNPVTIEHERAAQECYPLASIFSPAEIRKITVEGKFEFKGDGGYHIPDKQIKMAHGFPVELYHWMAPHECDEAGDGAWQAMLEDAVHMYNSEFNTNYDSNEAFHGYVQWKHKDLL